MRLSISPIKALPLVLAGGLAALWPAVAGASGFGDSLRDTVTGGGPVTVAEYTVEYVPGRAGGGREADNPDTFDDAVSSGKYIVHVKLGGVAADAPNATGTCTPTQDSGDVELKLPSMGIGTTPPAELKGEGGLVARPMTSYVRGWTGQRTGVQQDFSYTTCSIAPNSDPPQRQSTTVNRFVNMWYEGGTTPDWDFGDGRGGDTGWSGARHTYYQSSAAQEWDSDSGLPAFRITFHMSLPFHIETSAFNQVHVVPETRNRSYPVREVQSILN